MPRRSNAEHVSESIKGTGHRCDCHVVKRRHRKCHHNLSSQKKGKLLKCTLSDLPIDQCANSRENQEFKEIHKAPLKDEVNKFVLLLIV